MRGRPADVAAGGHERERPLRWHRRLRDVAAHVARAVASQQHATVSAGIAFYAAWAFFPALVALVIVGARVFGTDRVLALLTKIRIELPKSFDIVVGGQLTAIAQHSPRTSVVTIIVALGLATWSAMRGARALMLALNDVYGDEETRSFWQRQALAFGFSCFGGAFVVIALGVILTGPGGALAPEREIAFVVFAPSRWPLLIVALSLALSVLFRYGPARPTPRWAWVSWGAATSAVIWVAGSFLFSLFAARYTRFSPLLGSLAAVTIFLAWIYLTVRVLLLGAEINAGLEGAATGRLPASS